MKEQVILVFQFHIHILRNEVAQHAIVSFLKSLCLSSLETTFKCGKSLPDQD